MLSPMNDTVKTGRLRDPGDTEETDGSTSTTEHVKSASEDAAERALREAVSNVPR